MLPKAIYFRENLENIRTDINETDIEERMYVVGKMKVTTPSSPYFVLSKISQSKCCLSR